jgi:hypothetical protein
MIWFDVPEYAPLQVTLCGKVRAKTYPTKRGQRHSDDVVLINHEFHQVVTKHGYKKINYQPDGSRTPLYVHRLIALTFVEGYQDGLQVNHKNGIKTDNRPDNLEWITAAANVIHAWESGLAANRGEKSAQAKLTNEDVRTIRRLADSGIAKREIAKRFPQVTYPLVCMIARRERWAHVK